MDSKIFRKGRINPKENANILSLVSFFYVRKLFRIGHKGDIEEDDLCHVMKKFRSKIVGDSLQDIWEKTRKEKKTISTFHMLFAYCYKKFLILGIIQLIMKTIFVIVKPLVLSKFVHYFMPNQKELSLEDAYFYGFLVVGMSLFQFIYDQNYYLVKTELRIELQTALCSLIYRKSLKLSTKGLGQITTGKIVTLISKDINVFEDLIYAGNDLWVETIQLLVIAYLFYSKVGAAGFVGFVFLFMTIPLQVFLSKMIYSRRSVCNKKSDERLQLTQHVLASIRIIKFYTWEKIFKSKIIEARRIEMQKLRELLIFKDISYFCGRICSKLSFFMLISSYVWMGHNLTAEIVYYILNCYDNIETSITYLIPLCISHVGEIVASIKRFDELMNADEIEENTARNDISKKAEIVLRNIDVKIDTFKLDQINLDLTKGLHIISGPVGSGKSLLLKTILQECSIESGKIKIAGTISYASQNPWLFPSTIKQNILFGQEFKQNKYDNILNICCLRYDLETLAEGDRTIIGDCGINLSKGQQARINLARAIYKDSDIYLLDDCVSALDAHVRRNIFENCIKYYLKDKICVFVTHHTDFLKQADTSIILDDGRISFCGKIESNSPVLKQISSFENPGNLEKEKTLDDAEDKDESQLLEKFSKDDDKLNIYHEEKKSGKVLISVYRRYIEIGGGFIFFGFIVALILVADGCNTYGKKIISDWVDVDEHLSTIIQKTNGTNTTEYSDLLTDRSHMFTLYTIMVTVSAVLFLFCFVVYYTFTKKVSIKLHNKMISSILGSKMRFFDTHLIGNILNRFSKDLYYIDENLVYTVNEFVLIISLIGGAAFLMGNVDKEFFVTAVIFLAMYVVLGCYFLPIGRSLKRLNSSTRSPVVGHLNASLEGLLTVRATGNQNVLKDEFDYHQDLYTSAHHTLNVFQTSFNFVMNLLSSIFIAVIVGHFLFVKGDTAGNVGLVLSQAFLITVCLEYCLIQWVQLESEMTCFERALEYIDVEQETEKGQTIKKWPTAGKVTFNNVSLKYCSKGDNVLKSLSFDIKPGQKISIVGRTGAGKSSILVALFRLYDAEGDIFIDDVDTNVLSLSCLRGNVAIIPQDPVLFSGTLRFNLDPYAKYTDAEIWTALEAAKLKGLVESLDDVISECDEKLSTGQKQLICLVRALLNKSKIIVLDEATANVDEEMDKYMYGVIRQHFEKCTVISISHRLPQVLESDQVLVLNKGELVETGTPSELLANPQGRFYKMAENAGLLMTD